VGSRLGLLSLLRTLCSGTLLLALLDGGDTGGRTSLGSLCATLLDHIEGGTDNGTLSLDLLAAAGLGLLL
jgi:hypothetical protein